MDVALFAFLFPAFVLITESSSQCPFNMKRRWHPSKLNLQQHGGQTDIILYHCLDGVLQNLKQSSTIVGSKQHLCLTSRWFPLQESIERKNKETWPWVWRKESVCAAYLPSL